MSALTHRQSTGLYQPATTSFNFDPDPITADNIFMALADPGSSLAVIAEEFRTTIPALTFWLETPEIAARVDALDSSFRRRTRMVLSNYAGNVIGMVSRIVDQFHYAENQLFQHPRDAVAFELSRKNRETGLKAAHYFLRLCAQFAPSPAPRAKARVPSDAPEPAPPTRTGPTARLSAESANLELSNVQIEIQTQEPNAPQSDVPRSFERSENDRAGAQETSNNQPTHSSPIPQSPTQTCAAPNSEAALAAPSPNFVTPSLRHITSSSPVSSSHAPRSPPFHP